MRGSSDGVDLVVSVGAFLRRIDTMAAEAPSGAAARELLEKHGLDEAVIKAPRVALTELQVPPAPEPGPVGPEEMAAREKALWD